MILDARRVQLPKIYGPGVGLAALSVRRQKVCHSLTKPKYSVQLARGAVDMP